MSIENEGLYVYKSSGGTLEIRVEQYFSGIIVVIQHAISALDEAEVAVIMEGLLGHGIEMRALNRLV